MNKLLLIMIISTVIVLPVASYAMPSVIHIIEFKNIGEYISFENKMKGRLNMPITPVNYETGLPEPGKQLTTDYTEPIFHKEQSRADILIFADDKADLRGLQILERSEAIGKGWDLDGDKER